MHKTIYIIDEDGYFVSEMYASEEEMEYMIYAEVEPPEGENPRWNGDKWLIENGGGVDEPVAPPNIYIRVDTMESVMMELLMRGK